ncbi:MAG: chemotaxis protein CheW [Candidatus Hydrogenedentales bacterium]|jgi:purine-binding chemotaxis protein CheW
MRIDTDIPLPWLIFSLDRQSYAINGAYTREMTSVGDPLKIPYSPEYVRGAMSLRGMVMTLVDLRLWVGLKSARVEIDHLVNEMHKREQDHRDWLQELEASIKEKRPFTKATDPHKCAFGKWYDTFTTDNALFREVLRRFDSPHAAIHGVASEALAAAEAGHFDAAQAIIDETRATTLKVMVNLFEEFRDTLRNCTREIAIILEKDGSTCAVAVDSVDAVEQLQPEFESTSIMFQDGLPLRIPKIGRRKKDGSSVLIVDAEVLFKEMLRVSPESVEAT